MDKGTAEWIRCFVCGGKTRDKNHNSLALFFY